MKILITGVAGLLGSRLAQYIIDKDPLCTVYGIDDLSGGYYENIPKKVKFSNIRIQDNTGFLEEIMENDIDYVFHFAAYAAEGLSPFIRTYNYDNNLLATARIVNMCIKYRVKRLVFTSSMAVYGDYGAEILYESMQPKPIDPYGVAKYACEMDIQIAGKQHGLDWCIIRPHNVYGIGQNIWDKYRNVLGIWMYQHINNQPLSIFGDGQQTRLFSYIDDSLEPLFKAAILPEASKQIINLGGIQERSILKAANTLLYVMGGGTLEFHEARHEVKHTKPSYLKSVEILGFEHKTDLKEGLIKMWEWAQIQPNRDRMVWNQYEVNKNLYKFWKV